MAEDKKAIKYSDGNVYRTESIRVKTTRNGESDGRITPANGKNFYLESEVDSINLDFQAEVRVKGTLFTSDWDLGMEIPNFVNYSQTNNNSWGVGNGDDKRILYNAEFNEAFKTRDPSKEADVLWVRIESDPIIPQKKIDTSTGKVIDVPLYNSVRQITLNFNTDNTDTDSAGHYKYRPYFIFYTGPENIDREQGWKVRHSQPVVLNLNEDLNAIIYMPNSPVVINGNKNTWHGFIIARCFLYSVTSEDMTGKKPFTLYDGFNMPSICPGGYTEGTDSNGYTVYFESDKLVTRSKINETHTKKELLEDSKGNITVKEKIDLPKTPVIRFTKDEYKDCKTLQDYFDVTANHINTNYTKEKYAKFAEIDETEVSMITFPDEKENFRYDDKGTIKTFQNTKYGNFTAITIPVATADLEDNDHDPDALTKDNKYVKVMLGDEPKYIAKSKLPYINVRWNDSSKAYYPYVCIYDLKTDLGTGLEIPLICVKPTDDSILPSTTNKNDNSAVVFFNDGNNWKDTWVIERRVAEDIYKKEYIPEKLVLGNNNEIDYFMFKKDVEAAQNPKVIAKYRKITLANGDVLYAKEGDDLFYTKINNNTSHPENNNYIIVDENGNMLTKPVTEPSIFGVTSEVTNNNFMSQIDSIVSPNLYAYLKTYTRKPLVPPKNSGDLREQPDDKELIIDGKYRGHNTAHLYRDYRIPAFERVYYKSTFNLSENSYYSFFDIRKPVDLWRVNYKYLNVN